MCVWRDMLFAEALVSVAELSGVVCLSVCLSVCDVDADLFLQ